MMKCRKGRANVCDRRMLSLLFCCWIFTSVRAFPEDLEMEVLKLLLSASRPSDYWREELARRSVRWPWSGPFGPDRAPGDNAPLDVLIGYWLEMAGRPDAGTPSDIVKSRLLDACETWPVYLTDVLRYVPRETESLGRVLMLLRRVQRTGELGHDWEETVRWWLMLNSDLLLDDLREAAGCVVFETAN